MPWFDKPIKPHEFLDETGKPVATLIDKPSPVPSLEPPRAPPHTERPGTKTLDYIALGLLLAPPAVVVEMYMKDEPINWRKTFIVTVVCWVAGGFAVLASHGWQSWHSSNWRVLPYLIAAEGKIWGKAVIITICIGGALLLSSLLSADREIPSNPSPTGFTQRQVDEKIAAVTAPIQAKLNAADNTIAQLQTNITALQQQSPNASLQAQLNDYKSRLETAQQTIQGMEDFQKGVFKPFPAGQIQIRQLIHKEAEDLIIHLNDVTDFVRTADHLPSIFDLLPINRPGIPQEPHYPQSLEKPGIPTALIRLKEFQEAITAFRDELADKIQAEPKYASDLFYIVGNTNVDNLITIVSTYRSRLDLIDKDNSKHPEYPLNIAIITLVLGESPIQTQKALNNFWQWSNEFVNQRSGLARREINKYL
jgi:hypothetical protein